MTPLLTHLQRGDKVAPALPRIRRCHSRPGTAALKIRCSRRVRFAPFADLGPTERDQARLVGPRIILFEQCASECSVIFLLTTGACFGAPLRGEMNDRQVPAMFDRDKATGEAQSTTGKS